MTHFPSDLDPRHLAPAPLVPPAPLPYVSRRALRRVKDRVAIPRLCHNCGGLVMLVGHETVYQGRTFGEWPFLYYCSDCGSYVGLHPGTDLPLGTLADEDTRQRRMHAKRLFTSCVQRFFRRHRQNARNYAYDWLAARMGIPRRECHFAWFDIDRCDIAAEICGDALADNVAHGWKSPQ